MADRELIIPVIHMGQSLKVGAPVGGDVSATPPPVPRAQYYSSLKTDRALRCMSLGAHAAGAYSPMWWFAHHLHELTGLRSAHLMIAKAGSALLQPANTGGNGFWQCDLPGSLYDEAVPAIQNFLRGLKASPRYRFSDVYSDRGQGEQDADEFVPQGLTEQQYEVALQEQLDRLRADIASVPGCRLKRFYHVELGRRASNGNATGFDAIRRAQHAFVAANPQIAAWSFTGASTPGPLVVDDDGYHVSGCQFADDVHQTGFMNMVTGRTQARNFAINEGLL